jgi:hypothetical protein
LALHFRQREVPGAGGPQARLEPPEPAAAVPAAVPGQSSRLEDQAAPAPHPGLALSAGVVAKAPWVAAVVARQPEPLCLALSLAVAVVVVQQPMSVLLAPLDWL